MGDDTKEKLFCTKPFRFFGPAPSGNCFLCCSSWLPYSVGNWQKEELEQIWNSDKAVAIRKSILDGSFSYCNRRQCPNLQSKSRSVMTVTEARKNRYFRQIIDNQQTKIEFPQDITCTYDRSCNLSCPSCRTSKITTPQLDTSKVESFITNNLKHIRHLYVTGSGDPFASKSFYSLLQSIDGRNLPKLHITLHTNGLLFTEQRWKKLKGIHKNVKTVHVSIDAGTADTYAVNRRGGNWSTLLQRLDFISSLKIPTFQISMVVQENNFHEMRDFVELGRRIGARVKFSRLQNWGTFSEEEYLTRAIHQTAHPRHETFMDELRTVSELGKDVWVFNFLDMLSGNEESEYS